MIPLRSKLSLISYLAGGYFFARKDANATICNLSVKYPEFLSVAYDGCFFGPISSEIEQAFEEAMNAGYFNEYYFVVRTEPAHKVRILSDFGRSLAEKILKNPFVLEEIGLAEKQIPELSSEILCFNTLPTSYAVMNSLNLQGVEKKEVLVKRLDDPPLREPPVPLEIDLRIKDESIKKLTEIYASKDWSWIISVNKLHKSRSSFSLPYGIVSENIKERYNYLIPERSDISRFIERAEDATKKKSQEDFLLKEMATERIVPNFSPQRVKNLEALIREYPEIPTFYTERLIGNLELLEKNYTQTIENGYNHIFDDFLKPLADLSQQLFQEETLKNQLHVRIEFNRNKTKFSLNIPDEMQQKFSGGLNYGVGHYHLGHFPQAEQNSYFVDIGQEDYVVEVGKRYIV